MTTKQDPQTIHLTPQVIIAKKRLNNGPHTPAEIHWFIRQFMAGEVKDYQMTAWLMAICLNGMTDEETAALTEAMVQSGEVMDWSFCSSLDVKPCKIDKHSTGGVGDKVSLILSPLVASFGLIVPMMAGRGLGHSGGTIDKLESIPGFRTQYSAKEFADLLMSPSKAHSNIRPEPLGVAIVSPSQNICPADKRMYALRDVTSTVTSLPLQTSSIMSKKIAERPDYLVLDVKFGKGSFNTHVEESLELAKRMIQTGELCGIQTSALVTRMDNPLGYAVGNWLEVKECIEVMTMGESDQKREECMERSKTLIYVTLALAGYMLVQVGIASTLKQGIAMSREHLLNRKAWKKFKEMVEAQGGDVSFLESPKNYPEAKYSANIYSPETGYISSIDSMEIGLVAVLLGAGRNTVEDKVDFSSGIVFHVQPGMYVSESQILATIYTERKMVLPSAKLRVEHAFYFGNEEGNDSLRPLITHCVTKDSVQEFDHSNFGV